MSKNNGNNQELVDCPRCKGQGNLGKSSTAHVYAVETCPICKGQRQVSRRWLEKQQAQELEAMEVSDGTD